MKRSTVKKKSIILLIFSKKTDIRKTVYVMVTTKSPITEWLHKRFLLTLYKKTLSIPVA